MKYMGSKRWMLCNGLGQLIQNELRTAKRFVDLFCGSGAVTDYAAAAGRIEVIAYDLQEFCVVLAGATVARDSILDPSNIWPKWYARATDYLRTRRRS